MTLNRGLFLVVPIAAAVLGLPGCDKSNGEPATASSASAPIAQSAAPSASSAPVASASAAASAGPAMRAPIDRRAGLAGLMFNAARELDLTADQQGALDKLDEPLREDDDTKLEIKAAHADLIDGIKAGKVDTALMQKHYAAIDKAAQAHQDKVADSLNGLRGTLDAAQRKALVAAVRAKQATREDTAGARKGDAPDAGGGPAEFTKRRLDRMIKDLDLDAAQQKAVAAALAKGDRPSPAAIDARKAEGKKRIDALLAAFERETFDAKKLDLSDTPPKKTHERIDNQAQFLAQIAPILKPEQREKLAASVNRQAGHGRPGGPAADEPADEVGDSIFSL